MPERASRWEIAGAWLHVWTPPRDVEVPDPPWGRIAAIAVAVLVALGVVLAISIPKIDDAKQEGAREEARRLAASQRVERARLVRDQRMVRGRADIPRGAGAEKALTDAIALAVVAETRRRQAAGELEGRVIEDEARCRRRPSPATRLRLECIAVTATVDSGDARGRVGSIGYPFLAAGSLKTGAFNFCKTNPQPGENAARFGKDAPPVLPKGCGF